MKFTELLAVMFSWILFGQLSSTKTAHQTKAVHVHLCWVTPKAENVPIFVIYIT